jgi:hypothetical protein
MGETIGLIWDGLWGANPWPGRLIVLAIFVVITKALLAARGLLARYQREERAIRSVATSLEAWQVNRHLAPSGKSEKDASSQETESGSPSSGSESSGSEGTDAEAETPPLEADENASSSPQHPGLIDVDQLLLSVDASTLIGDRLRAISEMRRYRVKIDLDTLQELARHRDATAPGHGYPAFASSLSMMLGILGTFVGLSIMVQQIHLGLPTDLAGLTPDSWLDSVKQLGSVLGGMKTAFSTSLLGMVGAIVASTASFRIAYRRQHVFEMLERLSSAELIPATVPTVEDELLLAQVARQLDDSFSKLDLIYGQNQEALQELTAAQGAFISIVDDVRDITRGQAARNLDGILGQLAQSNEAVLAVSRQIPGIVSALETTARGVRDSAQRPAWMEHRAAGSGAGFLGLRSAAWLGILVFLASILVVARMLNGL